MTSKQLIAAIAAAASLTAGGIISDAQIQAQDVLINPYTDTGTKLETRIKGNLVEVDKASPKITLHKWNGEDSLGVSYSKTKTGAKTSRQVLTKIAQYDVSKDESVVMEPTDDGEGFNIDIKLNSKPTSNVFTYQFENWQDKDFFYQPPLNVEMASSTCTETDCGGSHRDENVVGSYAVYSKTKVDHIAGKTNYETGKLFQIPRPQVSDANGSTTWGSLDYKDGILSVIVPQDFLNKAIYPILVDPTFGYTSAGASFLTSGSSTDSEGAMRGVGITSQISQLAGYFKVMAAGSAQYVLKLLAESSSAPNVSTVYLTSGNVPMSNTTVALKTFPSSYSMTGSNYWVYGYPSYTGFVQGGLAYDTSGGTSGANAVRLDFGSWTTSNSYLISVYATYANGTGPNAPSGVTDDSSTGTVAWTTPGNATSSDANYATVTQASVSALTHYLWATGFGFSIPAGATINGMVVEVQKKTTNSNQSLDNIVSLIKGGSVQATNRADTSTYWPTTEAYTGYGGSTDLWGGSWTPSDINASNFGVAFSANAGPCFPRGTLISTPEGHKRIEDIKVGDQVYTVDENTRGLYQSTVTSLRISSTNKVSLIRTEEGQVEATPDHLILTNTGFVKAGLLKPGDIVFFYNKGRINPSVIKDNVTKFKQATTYDFGVSQNHTYLANGYVVHNFGSNATTYVNNIRISVYFTASSGGAQVQTRVIIIE